jgi:hypothetical protein
MRRKTKGLCRFDPWVLPLLFFSFFFLSAATMMMVIDGNDGDLQEEATGSGSECEGHGLCLGYWRWKRAVSNWVLVIVFVLEWLLAMDDLGKARVVKGVHGMRLRW